LEVDEPIRAALGERGDVMYVEIVGRNGDAPKNRALLATFD
jgi:hypothetical protein